MKNSEQPAFPVFEVTEDGDISGQKGGLTKREYVAIKAMQALLSNPNIFQMYPNSNVETIMNMISVSAIEHADDLLATLEKTQP